MKTKMEIIGRNGKFFELVCALYCRFLGDWVIHYFGNMNSEMDKCHGQIGCVPPFICTISWRIMKPRFFLVVEDKGSLLLNHGSSSMYSTIIM